jgi:Leucine-rich repeat (LRR) protein
VSNNLVGTIPPEIYRLGSLERLALGENCLHSTLPSEIFRLTRLKDIDLSWNYLSGTVPRELYGLKSLTKLNLHGNSDGGICNHTLQESLSVLSHGLEGDILGPGIGKLQNLEVLNVYTNNFSGSIASEIGQLNRLGACKRILDQMFLV